MKKSPLALLLLLFTLSLSAQAELDISKGKLQAGGHGVLFSPSNYSSIIGGAGYLGYNLPLKDKISIIPEGRLGTGLTTSSMENSALSTNDIKLGINYFLSLGAKAQYDIDSKVYVNGGLAFTKVSTKVKVGIYSASTTSNLRLGLSLGGGYKLSETLAIDARMDIVDDINMYSLGVVVPL